MDQLIFALQQAHRTNGADFPDGSVIVTHAYGNLKNTVTRNKMNIHLHLIKYNFVKVAHAVGPKVHRMPSDEDKRNLQLCYQRALDGLIENNGHTIAFPLISTGAFGYPRGLAAIAAFEAVLKWLAETPSAAQVYSILFVAFRPPDERLVKDVLLMAKRSIVASTRPTRAHHIQQRSTNDMQDAFSPSTSVVPETPPHLTRLHSVVPETPSDLPRLQEVLGDGDCFFRSICFSLFGCDNQVNSDALRKSMGNLLLSIVEDSSNFPPNNYNSHEAFLAHLRLALLEFDSPEWFNQSLTAYAQHLQTPFRSGGQWAQLDDGFLAAILLQRPVVILRPMLPQDVLVNAATSWDNTTLPQQINAYFPDGIVMTMPRSVAHQELSNFVMRNDDGEGHIVERIVTNSAILWYNGINHFQPLVVDASPALNEESSIQGRLSPSLSFVQFECCRGGVYFITEQRMQGRLSPSHSFVQSEYSHKPFQPPKQHSNLFKQFGDVKKS
uniref:Macro domain-containing protein n=1 Tax=Globodera rostochiensis TaxID=31243 RepID=A0A914GSN9_GLORO